MNRNVFKFVDKKIIVKKEDFRKQIINTRKKNKLDETLFFHVRIHHWPPYETSLE